MVTISADFSCNFYVMYICVTIPPDVMRSSIEKWTTASLVCAATLVCVVHVKARHVQALTSVHKGCLGGTISPDVVPTGSPTHASCFRWSTVQRVGPPGHDLCPHSGENTEDFPGRKGVLSFTWNGPFLVS